MAENTQSWEDLIINRSGDLKFKSRTCRIYNIQSSSPDNIRDKLCPCGRMIRRHSSTDDTLETREIGKGNTEFKPPNEFLYSNIHSVAVPVNVFGTLQPSGCKFLRIDTRIPMKDLFKLILEDCGGQKPALILSIYGGAKYFTMTERLEKEFIRGVIDTATMANAWILTTGINNGVSKLVGEGISHYSLIREYSNKVKCIGMTMWGTINENTRLELKSQSRANPRPLCERQIPGNLVEDSEAIERNHTHCLLFDSGKLNDYLGDSQRHQFVIEACKNTNDGYTCYAVTIIVEGGVNSLEILQNDIEGKRPIVLIQGSGRIADVLAMLVEQTSNFDRNQYSEPTPEEIKQALDRFYPNLHVSEVSERIKQIQNILKEENRHLLHVFSLNRDKNVAETIFKAIFTVTQKKTKLESTQKDKNEPLEQEKQRRKGEDKLVDLALEWNYFDGVLPILQAQQNDVIHKKKDFIQGDIERQKQLFRKSLEKNRSTFIEYFLISGFDLLTLIENSDIPTYQRFILDLYDKSYNEMNKSHKNRVKMLFGTTNFRSIEELDYKLNQFVGSFFGSIYSVKEDSFLNRIKIDLRNRVCTCCGSQGHIEKDHELNVIQNIKKIYPIENIYTKHHILRDLFLWSIFMDMPEMAKVLLFHVRSRICAALLASAIFKKYSKLSPTIDMRDKFQIQALNFETYAGMFIDQCYEYNDKRACELLLRQIPLFGNTTCMQLAISSASSKLLETACFDQTLNQVWFDKLSLSNHELKEKVSRSLAILTFGLTAPWSVSYRIETDESSNNTKDDDLSQVGINYYVDEQNSKEGKSTNYWKHFRYFHESPMISYIWFLLVFSYMMLYHLDARNTFDIPHWTEIYVIITVSTMLYEEARRLRYQYVTRMTERWGSTGSTAFTFLSNIFYILPYFLFYMGLGFRYGSYNEGLLSTARIIWALDLELWYLRSLKFVIALKFLGPKLFMLKNMLRDLFAFVYMIFIAIAAYGVVSRALIFYKEIPFTGRGILTEIFYEPYWFMYGEFSDKDLLDERIRNGTNVRGGGAAEATATHVLLAFHMLFINILLLNLLVAVFADSIGKVQANTEFYWRYQRYSFVREYFEYLPLSYPPFIIISHIILIILTIKNACCSKLGRNQVATDNYVPVSKRLTRIFKMIPIQDSQNEHWDLFENAATYSCARSILQKNKNNDTLTTDHEKLSKSLTPMNSNVEKTTVGQQKTLENVYELMSTFQSVLNETRQELKETNLRMESRIDQISKSFDSTRHTTQQGKTNGQKYSRPTSAASVKSDSSFRNQATTLTRNSVQ
ncbi:unnamed protein product [Rotaria sp. Silwood1]|nr:unnamed protein product [Rotaria sp. Silwood1]CAF1191478.1 unnamed protein product [Rotaria sp. Silwood1]CAF3437301.1 unnamed protein product [Rotaria sp. Silwood1]CAF3483381.1 unnamed protein product [Rotaria sp. Silwood1]CAF4580872.1 unnamed protein product [Rotaria sp. Silwood1]